MKAHQKLCDGIDLVNSTFTLHLASILIDIIIIKTFSFYGVLWELMSGSNFQDITIAQYSFWLTVIYILQIIICFVGSSVAENAKETNKIVSKILNESVFDGEITLNLQNFINRANCRNLNLQNSFFTMNWKLLVQVSTTKF